ncbi:CBS domain-containing protein [Zunongwangia atlantica]|uniref:XRE family transcriptional regulator n=1 Tax=Zunongwangia atlantica 22II14-10F7 TaxID=1185767 RepID=A0A1Y1T5N6_9FLAO|nr:CBS domain-containing protein [Zunongwangia atlantica]ORL46350.1 XRE family transcriptional regulator [Zunongwangia atlantica 22II14-10F7]
MPRTEFVELVKEIKKKGKGKKMTKREFIWLFDFYEKRTSGNVWRINEYLEKQKMVVVPNYQGGWIDDEVTLKEKDKARIINGETFEEKFDPINRLSVLKAAAKTPISISRDASLKKAYHILWKHEFTQVPIMNNEREVLGVVSWQSLAKGLIAGKESDCVKDFMTNDFEIIDDETPLFDAIKSVIRRGVAFVRDKEKKIKGPVTPSDLSEEFIEQIEPYILLEQIENFIRLILHDKIILEDLLKLLTIEDENRKIESISDMTFGEYLRVIENDEMWDILKLPFVKADFTNELDEIRKIRNGVMHFHPDKISEEDLIQLRKMSKFLMDYNENC